MKRRTLAIILLCIGIVGLLLPWRYTLYSGEQYSIIQNPLGGQTIDPQLRGSAFHVFTKQ